MKKLLLQTCCAPCSLMPYTHLSKEYNTTLFFYNPNIHPQEEFEKRRDTFLSYVITDSIDYISDNEYKGFEVWEKSLPTFSYPTRCVSCYTPRFEETARKAKELGYDCFSTTLLYSRYQQQEIIIEAGHKIAEIYGLEFIDRDFRPYWNEGIALSKEKQFYRQKYCGCGLPYK